MLVKMKQRFCANVLEGAPDI